MTIAIVNRTRLLSGAILLAAGALAPVAAAAPDHVTHRPPLRSGATVPPGSDTNGSGRDAVHL